MEDLMTYLKTDFVAGIISAIASLALVVMGVKIIMSIPEEVEEELLRKGRDPAKIAGILETVWFLAVILTAFAGPIVIKRFINNF